MVDKASIRHEALLHRDRIDPREESAEEACRLFFEALTPTPGAVIAAYWPKGREFDTIPLIHEALTRGYPCALPVMQGGDERVLKFARWAEDAPLTPGPFGIMQPVMDAQTELVDPDIIAVPCLAFDWRGYRLGYGKGFYDATLAYYRAAGRQMTAVGYAYGRQAVLFNLPIDKHDQRLDWIITPQKAVKIGG